jgi:hypothetical protein
MVVPLLVEIDAILTDNLDWPEKVRDLEARSKDNDIKFFANTRLAYNAGGIDLRNALRNKVEIFSMQRFQIPRVKDTALAAY